MVLKSVLVVLCGLAAGIVAQSNYASHANNVEYQGDGLPEQTILDGKVTKLDDLSPVIFLNRTKAVLNCAAGVMQADLKFNEPFFGLVYADFDRNSACQLVGKGNLSYQLELPLKGCGTKQSPQRVFTNNIVVRFHPHLEMDGDEVITIVCRYPPPIAPLPAALPAPILEPIAPLPPAGQSLSGYQVLLIICAILFLSLVLLGLGCSYYCMKNRKVQVVHRHPFSSVGTGSEITKLSGSSLGNISMFEGLKIPRAHAPPISSSGSEQQLIASEHSDTMPSDYPSESPSSGHSEVEDVDIRSMGSYQNQAFVPEPRFDVQVRVKRAPPPPPISPSPSTSDAESIMLQQARNLTTILEREESVRSLDSVPRPVVQTITHIPEIHAAPVYSTVRKEHVQAENTLDMMNTAVKSTPVRGLGVERIETNKTEVLTTTTKRPAPPPPSILPYRSEMLQQSSDVVEAPVVVSPRPQLTSHVVDDVFLRTITEKKTIEDIERHKRLVTEYHAKPLPINSKWDVTIRNYPAPGQEGPREPGSDWDTHSETSTSTMPHTPLAERHLSQVNIERSYLSKLDIPPPNPPVQNWETLVRVLDPTPPIYTTTEEIKIEEPNLNILTTADREKWRQIITTESTLRTLLTEATVTEDYERIRTDQRYEQLFEPQKWDVIIRILAPPDKVSYDKNGQPNVVRYRKKQDWDNRSRRSSLPTLYEYDSDGSSIRTLTNDVPPPGGFHDLRSRRTSRSSFRSDGIDVRSMTEVMVDYSHADQADTLSDVSSRPSTYYRQSRQYSDDDDVDGYGYARGSMVRSLSQPSLARSASEFMEHWATTRKWDADTEPSSPEHSPKSVRSGRTSIAGSTVSTQRRRQAIINRTLGATTSGLSRSSESILDPNDGVTPFSRRERELFEASRNSRQEMQALSRSAGRLDEMQEQGGFVQGVRGQQMMFSRTSQSMQQSTSSKSTISSKLRQAWR